MCYKKKISEILMTYELEPEINDIYVEGITDKLVINRFLSKNNCSDFLVKEISDIDFNELDSDKYGELTFCSNNKNKLIVLTFELLELPNVDDLNNITIIIDKDFDYVFNRMTINKFLKYTDYNSIEMYLYNENCLNNFFITNRGFSLTTEEIIDYLDEILKDCFLISSIFNDDLTINKEKKVKYTNSIVKKKDKKFYFSLEDHLKKDLNQFSKTKEFDIYKESIQKLKYKIKEYDKRDIIRGHDFIEIFHYILDKLNREFEINLKTFENMIFQYLDYSELKKEPLFQYLYSKYCSNNQHTTQSSPYN
jgi:hypothetical protein